MLGLFSQQSTDAPVATEGSTTEESPAGTAARALAVEREAAIQEHGSPWAAGEDSNREAEIAAVTEASTQRQHILESGEQVGGFLCKLGKPSSSFFQWILSRDVTFVSLKALQGWKMGAGSSSSDTSLYCLFISHGARVVTGGSIDLNKEAAAPSQQRRRLSYPFPPAPSHRYPITVAINLVPLTAPPADPPKNIRDPGS